MGSESCEIDPSGSPPIRFAPILGRRDSRDRVDRGCRRVPGVGGEALPRSSRRRAFRTLGLDPLSSSACGNLVWFALDSRSQVPAEATLVSSGSSCRQRNYCDGAAFVFINWLYDRFEQPADYWVDSSHWVEFKVPGTSIAVEVPHSPALEMHDVDSLIGNIPADIYMAEQGAVVFVIAIAEYPRGTVDGFDSEGRDFLVHMSDAAIASRAGSKLLTRRPIELERWSGLEECVETPGGRRNELKPERPIVAWQRYYQSGDRMLQFRVMTLKSDYNADAEEFERIASRFFQSIHTESSI